MSDPVVILVFIVAGLVLMAVARQRLKRRQLARREEALTTRFGPETAHLIMDQQIFRGMTKEMLEASRGEPDDLEEERLRAKIKQTWKYNQAGVNRYKERIYLENHVVVGWKMS